MKQVFALSSRLPRFANAPSHRGIVSRFLHGEQPAKSGLVRERVIIVPGLTGLPVANAMREVVEASGIFTEVGQQLYSLEYSKMRNDAAANLDLQLPREVFLRQDVVLAVNRHGVENVEIVLWRLYAQCTMSANNLHDTATPVLGKRSSERKECI